MTASRPITFADPLSGAVDVVIIDAGVVGTATAHFWPSTASACCYARKAASPGNSRAATGAGFGSVFSSGILATGVGDNAV